MNSTILHWSYRDFRQMPEELTSCSDEVVEVYLKENFIPAIPRWFCEQMSRLTFLCLAGNLITYVPEEISLLINLESLDVSQNVVEALPKSVGKLQRLIRLKLSENKLTGLPKEIGQLQNLEILELSKNRLTELPIEMSHCLGLQELILDDNYFLCRIPTKVFTMPQITYLSAERCNLLLLPFIVNTDSLEFVKLFKNYTLTHYPMVLERFMQPNYDQFNAVQQNRTLKPFYYQRVRCDASSQNLIFPAELRTILDRRKSLQMPGSLVEIALRRCSPAKWSRCASLKECIPSELYARLRSGPVARCASIPCLNEIFNECILGLVKR
ncbi:leucine-rich repeat-containing protein 28 [Culex quinquefasciatus]|uniref:leucine-rich repeat-containing protein 28 n=1 Tax=Culex quinquefasciatus TaxID=7176 RepID=UPI0018E34293|nr:leucine-rich repeat-containing protein 28 [Culex quinquefasciatus]